MRRARRLRHERRLRLRGTLALLVAFGLACATYSQRVERTRAAAQFGDYAGALAESNRVLGADGDEPVPAGWDGRDPLVVLERAVLLQALGRYRDSADAFERAAEELEVLDLSRDAEGVLAEYLFSGSGKKYRTPPSERLALHALNLLNYLGLEDLQGAKVEARRFQVMRDYLDTVGGGGPVDLGAYLAGFVFEKGGEGERALRYYETALEERRLSSLDAAVGRLSRGHRYRGPALRARLDALGSGATRAQGGSPEEILVVASVGRVPFRVSERIGVGKAIGIAGTIATRDRRVLERSITKVIVYPELAPARSGRHPRELRVDGTPYAFELVGDLASNVREEYQEAKPKILAAALTRLAARAAVAEGVRAAGNQGSPALGTIVALATEASLVALDRPDTRSWNLLPAHVYAARIPVGPGSHRVELVFEGGQLEQREVDVPLGGFGVVVATDPR